MTKNNFSKLATLCFLSLLSLFISLGCSTSSSSTQVKLEGNRFGVQLARASNQNEWVSITGTQEWWFFAAGVFRQISTSYVEPQFYGQNVACSGDATGTWQVLPAQDNDASNLKRISLSYNGTTNVSGVCRMTNREIDATLQPSGAVDLLDGSVVQRLSKIEQLQ